MMTPAEALARHIEIARSYVGCNAHDDPARFGALVCPHGPPGAGAWFCQVHDDPKTPALEVPESSCGVAAVGFLTLLLDELGYHDLDHPMDPNWWARTVALAKAHGAYRVDGRPNVNAIIHVARGSAQHWRTIVGECEDGHVDTVDGGGRTATGHQLIHAARTSFAMTGTCCFDVMSGKIVTEWIDTEALLTSMIVACPKAEAAQ